MMRKSLLLLGHLFIAMHGGDAQTYETSMTTIPFFSVPVNATDPPRCDGLFLEEFSSSVWNWIHGLIEFTLRENDFELDQFTMVDQPYTRHLELLESGKTGEVEHRALVTAPASCKTCQYLACYTWCSPRMCLLCSADDDSRRRNLRSSIGGQRRKVHDSITSIDYNLLGLRISEIITGEVRQFLQSYDPAHYGCMGVANGLKVIVAFIPQS